MWMQMSYETIYFCGLRLLGSINRQLHGETTSLQEQVSYSPNQKAWPPSEGSYRFVVSMMLTDKNREQREKSREAESGPNQKELQCSVVWGDLDYLILECGHQARAWSGNTVQH